jgi:hypothetical protein
MDMAMEMDLRGKKWGGKIHRVEKMKIGRMEV